MRSLLICFLILVSGSAKSQFNSDFKGTVNATGYFLNGVPLTLSSSQWLTSGSNISYSLGNVGIGTNSPTEILDVNGTARLRSIIQDNTFSRIIVSDANGKLFWRDITTITGTSQWITTGSTINYSLGNVGIGVPTPSDLLDVGGSIRFRSLSQDNAQTKLLVGDINGKLFWRDISSLPGGSGGDNLGNHIAFQSVIPNVTNSYNLGSLTNKFKDLYLGGSIYLDGALYLQGVTPQSNPLKMIGVDYSGKIQYLPSSFDANFSNVCIGQTAINGGGGNLTSFGYNTIKDGVSSCAFGNNSLSVSTGFYNAGFGTSSMRKTTTGEGNSALGILSLSENTTGNYNVAIGIESSIYNVTGSNNTAIGAYSGPVIAGSGLTNTTAIGYNTKVNASNQVRIGNSSVTSIGGQVSWSTLSDGRFKLDVREDVSGLEFINLLRPVSYTIDRVKLNKFLGVKEADADLTITRGEPIRQTGFIAQEVEAALKKSRYVFNGIEVPQSNGEHYSIRYSDFVVPLTKAVQELSSIVSKQQQIIDELKKSINDDNLKESDQLELFQNNPNPFNQDTEIKMIVPETIQSASLYIYDLSGKQIEKRIITDRGEVKTRINGSELPAGIYLYLLIADGRSTPTRKMILID